MLNWRIEEDEYVNNYRLEHLEKLSIWQKIFLLHNEKKMNKYMNELSNEARLLYRQDKLDNYLDEVKKERNRINDLVDDLNNKFDSYMSNQQHIISKNIKPFQMEAKPYDNFSEPTLSQLEVVTIQCEPLKLSFIQEKVDD